ncbi:MAG: hypothetical protein IBX55_17140 [Methyloprofundus sp.]|nr:hypothetical protein [Methyloprofundus sp.]MBW6454131.1 hypothetical protein [Methyloprofundus sp.]
MERCPCCNARLKGAVDCPRCQADLSAVIGAEQTAEHYLAKAIQHWAHKQAEQSIAALMLALSLKKTALSLLFREYLIQHYYVEVVELLAGKHLLSANQQLYNARRLLPYSPQLQQLRTFTHYLLAQRHEPFQTSSL